MWNFIELDFANMVTVANTLTESVLLLNVLKYRQTSETKELVNGLMKDKCNAARRDQSYQLSLLKQKELTISQLCEHFQDSVLSSSLKAPVLRHYSQLFVLRTINSICLDQYVLFNPNSICIIGLAPSHSIMRNHHRCCSIQWGVSM